MTTNKDELTDAVKLVNQRMSCLVFIGVMSSYIFHAVSLKLGVVHRDPQPDDEYKLNFGKEIASNLFKDALRDSNLPEEGLIMDLEERKRLVVAMAHRVIKLME